MAFEGNPYDGHTLEPQLEQVSDLIDRLPKVALVDRGYEGRKTILGVEIMIPGSSKCKTAFE
jgi:IS5 family transposase